MSELKPCPFCGGSNLRPASISLNYVECRDCGCFGPSVPATALHIPRPEEQHDPETEEEAEDDATWYRQDYVEQLLAQQVEAAQKALDTYIMQVVAEHGQRHTLDALMAARDQARDALREVVAE